MGMTSAERVRRHRKHKAGDHSFCDPQRCAALGVTVTDETAVAAPSSESVTPQVNRPEPQQTRGEWLYEQLLKDETLGPGERVLAEEAGRLADRLDRLDEHLSDRRWLQFEVAPYSSDKTTTVIVKLDRVLAEVRQQQEVFKGLIGELRQAAIAAGKLKPAAPAPKGGPGLADLIELAARR